MTILARVATLGYILSPDGEKVLMVHRQGNPDDYHAGKFNGLGGKLEANEDIVSCMKREIYEEAGIQCTHLSLRGTISWPGFGKAGEDWFGFIFLIQQFTGVPKSFNTEGTLVWVEKTNITNLNLWAGDRHFLPLVFDPSIPQFHGVMPYQAGIPVSWSVSFLT